MKRERKKNRLQNYDYSRPGWYFVTICTKNRVEYFGKIQDNEMHFNTCGKIAQKCWFDLPNHYRNIHLDKWVIMPNHMHGIVVIDDFSDDVVGAGLKPSPTAPIHKQHSLSEIMRGFKTFSSRKINEFYPKLGFCWQRSFYDHIIRNDHSLESIRAYIKNNPLKWELDKNKKTDVRPH